MVGGGVSYGVNSYTEACIKLFIIIGGAFAVYKSRLLLISIVNPAAADSLAESGIISSFIAGRVVGVIGQQLKSRSFKQRREKKSESGGDSKGGQSQMKGQAFTGK